MMPVTRQLRCINPLFVAMAIVLIFLPVIGLSATPSTDNASSSLPANPPTNPGVFVTLADGPVYYLDEALVPKALQSFARLSVDVSIKLDTSASLQLVYLANGRQELWNGPASFTVGETESEAVQSATPPQVKTLPPFMLSTLAKSPEVISDIKSRQGMIRVRSLTTARKVREAEKNYQEMLEVSAPDDITPEIYLITTLDELRVYNRMVDPLETMITKQPDNLQAQELYDKFMAILESERQRVQ